MYSYSRQSIKNGHSRYIPITRYYSIILSHSSSTVSFILHYIHDTLQDTTHALAAVTCLPHHARIATGARVSLITIATSLAHQLSERNRRQVCVCTTGTAREKPEQRATWVSFTSTGCSLAPLSLVVLRRLARDMEGKLWSPGRAFSSPCLAGCRRPDTVPRIMLQIRWPGSFTAQYKTHASPAIGMFSYAPENSVLSLLARKPICNHELTYKSPSPSFRIYVLSRCPAYLHTCTGYRLTG